MTKRRGEEGGRAHLDAMKLRCLGIWSSGGVPVSAKEVRFNAGSTGVYQS